MNRDERWARRDTFAFLGVLLGALALRLVFVLLVRPTPVSDFRWYYQRALDLVHGLGYSVHGVATAFWPPGWPYFLAGVVWLFGPSVLAAEIVQSLLNALTAAIVFLIARKLWGTACGIAAGTAYAILPSAIEWCATLASEPLYTLLWACATYIWVSRPTDKLGWYALSGALLGAAALVRPSALFFWLILVVYLLTLREQRRRPWRIAGVAGVTALCTFIVVTPMIVRNYTIYHTFVLISNNGGVSLYQANNPDAGPGYTDMNDPRVQSLISNPRTEPQGDHLASSMAIKYMKTHPLHVLWFAVLKVKGLYSRDDLVIRFTLHQLHPQPPERVISSVAVINTVVYYALMLCALVGIIACIARRTPEPIDPAWRLVLGMTLYNTAIFSIIGGIDRYRYPTMPYFAVFAGIGILCALAYARSAFVTRIQTGSQA